MKAAAPILTALALLAACGQAEVASAGLCAAGETAFFECQTRSRKSIAVCGAPPGTLQYRYGTEKKVELGFPQDPASGTKSLLYAHYFRSQVDRTEITFTNQSVDYAVFDYTENGKRSAGVRVSPQGGKETEIACAGRVTSRLGELEKYLPCDRDNALAACR